MRAILPLLLLATPALAQTETVTVNADPVHLMQSAPGEAATGLALPLAQTPRAATQVSDVTLGRYGVEGLDDLTAITPSSYTGSFYGVEGSVNLRGTLADNYFRGFRRAENRGTYATPLTGDVTILRGPPSPVYGAGKVGGLVDISPAVAPADRVTVTYGAYEKRNLTAQGSLPVTAGGLQGSLSARGEIDDSFSFYRGLHPSYQSLTLGADLEFLSRPEWRAVREAYGLRFAASRAYAPSFMYRALESGQADVISAFSSDGRIAADDLAVLPDPAHALPGYDAILLVSPAHAGDQRFLGAIRRLIGAIPVEAMRRANYMVDRDRDKASPEAAARWLAAQLEHR